MAAGARTAATAPNSRRWPRRRSPSTRRIRRCDRCRYACRKRSIHSPTTRPSSVRAERALMRISWFATHLEWLHLTLRSGAPKGFRVNVKDAYVSAGAGFIVVSLGAISFMPGPRAPRTPLRWPLVATCASCHVPIDTPVATCRRSADQACVLQDRPRPRGSDRATCCRPVLVERYRGTPSSRV